MRSPRAAVDARNPRAHIWSPYVAAFEGDSVEVTKTKAHATQQDVDQGVSTAFERKANALADTLAKAGAKLAEQLVQNRRRFLAALGVARQIGRYVAKEQAASAQINRTLRDEDTAALWLSDGNCFRG